MPHRFHFVVALIAFSTLTACDPLPYNVCGGSNECGSGDSCYDVHAPLTTGGTAQGRFCSRQCTSDANCPSRRGLSGACYGLYGDPNGINVCYMRCNTTADCPAGSSCFNAARTDGGSDRICVPGAVASTRYERCSGGSSSASETCLNVRAPLSGGTTTNGNFCSNTCRSDADCAPRNGNSGACYGLYGDTSGVSVCYQRCTSQVNCAAGSACAPTTTGDMICIPVS